MEKEENQSNTNLDPNQESEKENSIPEENLETIKEQATDQDAKKEKKNLHQKKKLLNLKTN